MAVSPPGRYPLIGRDDELAAIEEQLNAPDSAPPIVVFRGEAGIGKTALWRIAVEQARERGYRVLACAPTEAERELSFAALRDLVGGSFADVEGKLPAPQRRALAIVLLREEPTGAPPEQGVIAVALLTAFRALARRGPVFLAIDDVQWLDAASAASLAYALRRLEGPMLAVLAHRTGVGEPEVVLGLDRLSPDEVRTFRVGALSVGAVGRLLHDRLGVTYPRPTLRRLHEISGGNPFFALEAAASLADTPAPPGAFPVPATLRELVRARLVALPAETRQVLLVVSALAHPTVELVATVVGADPLSLLEPAFRERVALADGDQLRFVHPLFGASVHELATSADRRELHRVLAELVEDPEERARHLALGTYEPAEEVAATVEAGAVAAFSRGAPAAAAELAAQAHRLTPPGKEADARRRALMECDYQFAAGDTERASALLDSLLADTPPGAGRAGLLSRKARVQHFQHDIRASVALLQEALGEAGEDAALRAEIEEGLAWGLLLIRRDLGAASEHARSAATFAESRDDPAALAEGLAALALTDFVLGRPWLATMERALELEPATLGLRVLRHPSFAYGYCLSCADETDRAREVFQELQRRAAERGDESSVPSLLNHLALIECLSGRWTEAAVLADEGYGRALESGQQPTQASILGKKALLAARAGAIEQAELHARRALGPNVEAEPAIRQGGETAIWALGVCELWKGDPEQAHALLGPMTEALLGAGIEEPGEIRCLPDEIEALVLLERLGEAERLTGRLEAWAQRVERPSILGEAARCRSLVLDARGASEAALSTLEQAATWHERSSLPFERARTLLALGTEQRRARKRKAARETLERAKTIFAELGAEPWAERADAESARIGGRPPSAGALTPTELQIARLVAAGRRNREVAEELVVSERTVESALTQIYRKLEIRSRTELARKIPELQ